MTRSGEGARHADDAVNGGLHAMRFDDGVSKFLRGEAFATDLAVRISERQRGVPTRVEYIEDRVRGKAVIHFGCADHLDVIDAKIARGTWLHKRITDSADVCLGVDINSEALDHMRTKHGYTNVVRCDLVNDEANAAITARRWDYIVMGEIVEHVDGPVELLKAVKAKYSASIARVIITVPNAFRLANFRNVLRHQEVNNTDHRYWFTPYTLGKIVTNAGLRVDDFDYCHYDELPDGDFLRRIIYKRYPAFRNNLVMTASL